jgi:hypothetical protein
MSVGLYNDFMPLAMPQAMPRVCMYLYVYAKYLCVWVRIYMYIDVYACNQYVYTQICMYMQLNASMCTWACAPRAGPCACRLQLHCCSKKRAGANRLARHAPSRLHFIPRCCFVNDTGILANTYIYIHIHTNTYKYSHSNLAIGAKVGSQAAWHVRHDWAGNCRQ